MWYSILNARNGYKTLGVGAVYKTVVVDDEKIAREVVIKFILSLNLNFEITGGFANGADALEYIKSNDVDVVITDIKMPKMSGMELCKNICKLKPKCKIVILSGYGEFTYARQAIEYNVFNYILKPVDPDELADVLTRLEETLDEEGIAEESENTGVLLEQEEFLLELIYGINFDINEVKNRMKDLKFPFDAENSEGKLVKITINDYEKFINDRWTYGKDKLPVAIGNILKKEMPESYVYPIVRHNDNIIFAVIGNGVNSEEIRKMANDLLSLDMNVETVLSFDNIANAHKNMSLIKNIDNEFEMIASYMNTGNGNTANIMLRRLAAICLNAGEYSFRRYLGKLSEILDCGEEPEKIYEEIKNEYDLTDEKSTEDFIGTLIKRAESGRKKGDEALINKILKFIDNNYMNDISRDDAAQHVYLNATYFSRYFSAKTGISFSDYLLDLRMKKAMELLEKNDKIYKIGESVGYKNNRNFLRTFKKYTGYTPSEYRLYVLKKEE